MNPGQPVKTQATRWVSEHPALILQIEEGRVAWYSDYENHGWLAFFGRTPVINFPAYHVPILRTLLEVTGTKPISRRMLINNTATAEYNYASNKRRKITRALYKDRWSQNTEIKIRPHDRSIMWSIDMLYVNVKMVCVLRITQSAFPWFKSWHTKAMTGYSWTEEEKALVIWFASIGLSHSNISKLLGHRSFDRSMTAVRNKIAEVRKEFELGCASNKLNFWEVDSWIRKLSLNCEPAHLLMPTITDQRVVYEVWILIFKYEYQLTLA